MSLARAGDRVGREVGPGFAHCIADHRRLTVLLARHRGPRLARYRTVTMHHQPAGTGAQSDFTSWAFIMLSDDQMLFTNKTSQALLQCRSEVQSAIIYFGLRCYWRCPGIEKVPLSHFQPDEGGERIPKSSIARNFGSNA